MDRQSNASWACDTVGTMDESEEWFVVGTIDLVARHPIAIEIHQNLLIGDDVFKSANLYFHGRSRTIHRSVHVKTSIEKRLTEYFLRG